MQIESVKDLGAAILAGVTDWSPYGDVKAVTRGDLIKFMYTSATTKRGRWNWLERNARGLIMSRVTGEVVAWPFAKFFNWNEGGRTTDAAVLSISEKMDGSLGILHIGDDGQIHATTKGSFNSEQAQFAQDFARRKCEPWSRDITLMVEIIYPKNRIIVDYGQAERLVLIGARIHGNGHMLGRPSLSGLGYNVRLPLAPVHRPRPVSEILRWMSEDTTDREGVVVSFEDGERFKFKTARYLEAHKAASATGPAQIAKIWLRSGWGAINRIKGSAIPRDAEQIEQWARVTADTFRERRNGAKALFAQAPEGDRKTKALWVNEQDESMRPLLFAQLAGKSMKPALKGLVVREMKRLEEDV